MAYELAATPRIVHAEHALDRLGPLAKELTADAKAVLLVADPGLRPGGLIERAALALETARLSVVVFDAFKSDPSAAQADAAAAIAREQKVGLVVALGGGSALDVGKTVAAIAPAGEPAAHYALCANPLPPRALPKICVPTTAGTGSETTRTTVLTLADGAKAWLWGDTMKADLVVLDPTASVGLPPALTAATGIDALVHALEACTNGNASPANDVYAHAAIRLVVQSLRRAVEVPDDLAARSAMLLAAALAGIAIDNAGTAIAHNIGHALASLRPIHHGRAVGLAMLASLPWNILDDDGRFARAAVAMGESGGAAALPEAFERLLRQVGVKVALGGEGFDELTAEQLAAQMARPENVAMLRSNRRQADERDLLELAEKVLTQA